MTRDEIHQKLTTVFRDVFDDDSIEIEDGTTANDIDGWDSITHVVLITAAEKAFNVKFVTKDVKALQNVGDFIRLIEARQR